MEAGPQLAQTPSPSVAGMVGGCHWWDWRVPLGTVLFYFLNFQGHLLRYVGKTKKCASVEGEKLKKKKNKKKTTRVKKLLLESR